MIGDDKILIKTVKILRPEIQGQSEENPTIVNVTRMVVQHWCNLAAKESGLECACVNNDDFTVLASEDGRCYWVGMCAVWPLHSKWLSND